MDEKKMEFLKKLDDPSEAAVFLQIAEKEEKILGKPIETWNKDELLNFYAQQNATHAYIICLHRTLREYIDWANPKNTTASIVYADIFNFIEKRKSTKVIFSKKEIEEYVSELKNAQDRFMYLAAFEGILGASSESLLLAKKQDFHNGTADVYINFSSPTFSRTISVSEATRENAIEAADTYVYYNKNGVGNVKLCGDRIIKFRSIQTELKDAFHAIFLRTKRFEKIHPGFTPRNCYLSGLTYEIQLACVELGLPPKEFSEKMEAWKGISYRYDIRYIPIQIKRYFNQ